MRLGRSRRREDGGVSLDAVLDAAVAVLSREPGAPLERIAARAGTDPRQVRALYPSRQALVDATVMRGARRIAHAAVIEDGGPAEQIGLLVARIWEDQAPVAPFTAMWMRSHLRAEVEGALEPVRALLADAIGRGAGPGGLRADLPASSVAWLVEHAVLTCLTGVADGAVAADTGRRLAITHALAAAGLSWDHAGDVATAVEHRVAGA
ncbi:TetR/AcrR family transcriptional regulator [Demequina activiva]|uniref:TetR family transcriptional regulator n=1 Tax=Demequina activiva TaxID=1582364 RepID=A0A919Q5V2_9MICO|nr:hypothetical protein [Demequina activiva]GIG54380.1 hypothetical protein Dac01nite_11320 [Demequina activiva]